MSDDLHGYKFDPLRTERIFDLKAQEPKFTISVSASERDAVLVRRLTDDTDRRNPLDGLEYDGQLLWWRLLVDGDFKRMFFERLEREVGRREEEREKKEEYFRKSADKSLQTLEGFSKEQTADTGETTDNTRTRTRERMYPIAPGQTNPDVPPRPGHQGEYEDNRGAKSDESNTLEMQGDHKFHTRRGE